MTVERAALVGFWPLVDVGVLKLKAGDVVVFRSDWLVEHGEHRVQFFDGVLRSTFTVGERTVIMTIRVAPDLGTIKAVWRPALVGGTQLPEAEWFQYQEGRDALWQRAANALGRKVFGG